MFGIGLVKLYNMQVWIRGSRDLLHEFQNYPLSRLLQIKQQHQQLTPGRYTFMIVGEDLLEYST